MASQTAHLLAMHLFRFTISQLLLAATLIALVIGLFTAAKRLGPRDVVGQLCFSPNGKLIAARFQSGVVRVWQLDGDQPRLVARAFGDSPLPSKHGEWLMEGIYFADDNRLLKVESHQLKRQVVVQELDIRTGKLSEVLRLPIQFAQQWNVAVSGEWLYVGDWGTGDVFCCNLKDRQIDRRLTVSPDPVHALQVSVDGRILAAIDQEGMANIVDLTSDKVIQRMPAAKTYYLVQFLSADGSKLITPAQPSMTKEGIIQKLAFWDTSSGKVEERPTTLEHGQYWLSMSRDGQRLAVSDSSQAIEFYDLATMRLLHRLSKEELFYASYQELSPDGTTLATSCDDQVMQWDIATGKRLCTLGGSESRAIPIAIFTLCFALWGAALGIARKRDRAQHAQKRAAAWAFPSRWRRLIVGIACMTVIGIVLVEVTITKTVTWKGVHSSWASLTHLQVFSLVALPFLVVALVRQMKGLAKPRTAENDVSPVVASAPPNAPPLALRLCWLLMIIGGLIALVIPISHLLLDREMVRWTAYYSLLAGVLAISRGASHDTRGLGATVGLQAINVIALDPFNLLLAGVERLLLRRSRVKQYLQAAGGSADKNGADTPVCP